MEIGQLRAFQLVASLGSFSKAALELHLTQPAVTRQIKNLEQELGEMLINRLGRSLALTPAGEVFLSYAQQILNLSELALTTLRQFSKERGRLTIGAGTTNVIFRLPEILKEYHREYPQVDVRIRSGDSDLISRFVCENAIDLGLVTTIQPNPALDVIPLFTDRILLVAAIDRPARLTPAQLEGESLILFRSGSGFRHFLDQQFREHQFTPKTSIELESMEAIIRLVQSGLGMAFLPEVAIREEITRGKLQPVVVAGWRIPARTTHLIRRIDKYLSWPVRAFLDLVQK
jgi:DNA-binding transcriptional LysR family regulator